MHDELIATAAELGLAERVHLPGVIHNSDLPAFMNALDVFVLPSETRSNWREQFGRVIVEAMSCGVPVIGSDSGEIPTVLGDAGLISKKAIARHWPGSCSACYPTPRSLSACPMQAGSACCGSSGSSR